MTRWIALAGAAGMAVGPALAQPSLVQAPPAGHAAEITVKARKPIVVTADTCPAPDPARHPADHAPAVVDSYPAQGAAVAPGYLRVRVSFDQPMSCFSEVMVDGGQGDPCEPDGTWALPERTSWMMTCRFAPDTAVRISFKRIEGRGFVGLSGREAQPYVLDFATSSDPARESLAEAAAADPGPPGQGRRTTALVTCVDRGRAPAASRDCRRETPASPP